MKKILFPTDFSETSNNAFIYALQLAKNLNAEVITLHVYELPMVDYINVPAYLADIYETVEMSTFQNYKGQIPILREIAAKHQLEDIKISNVLMDGDLVSTILQLIKEENIDYVVMGTKGASGLKEKFLGSSTGSVMTDSKAIVLGIPEESNYKKIERIVFSTRFREKDQNALRKVVKFAEAFGAHIDCLYIKTSKSDVKDVVIANWRLLFAESNTTFHIIENEDVEQSILNFTEQNNTDVLAMLHYKKGFFEGLFTQSLTKKLAFHIKIPLLALNED